MAMSDAQGWEITDHFAGIMSKGALNKALKAFLQKFEQERGRDWVGFKVLMKDYWDWHQKKKWAMDNHVRSWAKKNAPDAYNLLTDSGGSGNSALAFGSDVYKKVWQDPGMLPRHVITQSPYGGQKSHVYPGSYKPLYDAHTNAKKSPYGAPSLWDIKMPRGWKEDVTMNRTWADLYETRNERVESENLAKQYLNLIGKAAGYRFGFPSSSIKFPAQRKNPIKSKFWEVWWKIDSEPTLTDKGVIVPMYPRLVWGGAKSLKKTDLAEALLDAEQVYRQLKLNVSEDKFLDETKNHLRKKNPRSTWIRGKDVVALPIPLTGDVKRDGAELRKRFDSL